MNPKELDYFNIIASSQLMNKLERNRKQQFYFLLNKRMQRNWFYAGDYHFTLWIQDENFQQKILFNDNYSRWFKSKLPRKSKPQQLKGATEKEKEKRN